MAAEGSVNVNDRVIIDAYSLRRPGHVLEVRGAYAKVEIDSSGMVVRALVEQLVKL